MTAVDVAVVGGGPVGLAAAILAQAAGFQVRVLERQEPPIDKACGEGLMPDGVRALARLGVATEGLGRPFDGIRYLDGKAVAEGRFHAEPGRGVRRLALHRALATRAAEVGVDLAWGVSVDNVDRRLIRTSAGSFESAWIVAADGLHSPTRASLGIPVVTRGARFGVRRHYGIAPWSKLVEVWWGEECEAYVTPVGTSEVGVAFLWSGAKARFSTLLERFPPLANRLTGAPVTSKDRGIGPLWMVPKRLTSGSAALVGDAAGYLDAITGEGLSLGFRQAELLIRALSSGDLAGYERAVRRVRRWPFRLIRILLSVKRYPRLRRRLVRSLAADPEIFSRILSLQAGEISPRQLGLGRAGRLLLSLARQA